jgi:membrane-associated phospholipid phosphatase
MAPGRRHSTRSLLPVGASTCHGSYRRVFFYQPMTSCACEAELGVGLDGCGNAFPSGRSAGVFLLTVLAFALGPAWLGVVVACR